MSLNIFLYSDLPTYTIYVSNALSKKKQPDKNSRVHMPKNHGQVKRLFCITKRKTKRKQISYPYYYHCLVRIFLAN